jgi:hypothetical protein
MSHSVIVEGQYTRFIYIILRHKSETLIQIGTNCMSQVRYVQQFNMTTRSRRASYHPI